jgi:hypothetical protein
MMVARGLLDGRHDDRALRPAIRYRLHSFLHWGHAKPFISTKTVGQHVSAVLAKLHAPDP